MQIQRSDFDWLAEQGVLTPPQAQAAWEALHNRMNGAKDEHGSAPPFDFVHVAYYFGALLVIGAMGIFMGNHWEALGGAGIFWVSCLYAAVFVQASRVVQRREGLHVPAGLLLTMAVGMTPLATYGLQRALDWWPGVPPGSYGGFHTWIKSGWFAMEVATVATGLLALWERRFPFLVAPVAFVLYYMSMDVTPLWYGEHPSFEQRADVSMIFGLVVLAVAYAVDMLRTRQDFAFWLYLFGVMTFWGGLSSHDSHDELSKAIYMAINMGMIILSVLLYRRVFMVFGAMGAMGYIFHLARQVFKDSVMFPFALSLLGIGVIAAALYVHTRMALLQAWLQSALPPSLRSWLPPRRD